MAKLIRKLGIAVGPNKGYKTHPVQIKKVAKKGAKKPTEKKISRVNFIRQVVQEVAGWAPYERRLMELLKIGKDKRALRFVKARLGSHLRAKKKREQMATVLRKIKQEQLAAAKAAAEAAEKKQ